MTLTWPLELKRTDIISLQ